VIDPLVLAGRCHCCRRNGVHLLFYPALVRSRCYHRSLYAIFAQAYKMGIAAIDQEESRRGSFSAVFSHASHSISDLMSFGKQNVLLM